MKRRHMDNPRCAICNKKLSSQGAQSIRCSNCGTLYSRLKTKFPQKTEKELYALVRKKLKPEAFNQYNGGRKPKYIKVNSNDKL